jgi:Fur family ferric uptake transcriptional regulator
MLSKEDLFKEYLDSKKLKFTAERQAILDRVFANYKHFEADELLVDLRQNKLKISKATIYRTLSLLVKCGLLREVIHIMSRYMAMSTTTIWFAMTVV